MIRSRRDSGWLRHTKTKRATNAERLRQCIAGLRIEIPPIFIVLSLGQRGKKLYPDIALGRWPGGGGDFLPANHLPITAKSPEAGNSADSDLLSCFKVSM